jgi:hypothetical protein
MIDYNFAMFRAGIQKVFDVRKKQSRAFKKELASGDINAQESPP